VLERHKEREECITDLASGEVTIQQVIERQAPKRHAASTRLERLVHACALGELCWVRLQ
jgi:hypothetical protein